MKPIHRLALYGLLPLLLAGCQLLPTRGAPPAPTAEPTPPDLPFDEPTAEPAELDADLVYSVLVAEVAAQRGDLPLAYRHYLHAATLAHDAYAAERATRIAVYLKDLTGALVAARRWVELAPNSQDARMSLALLLEGSGDRAGALKQLEALLAISDALGQDGYTQVAQVLAKERGGDRLGLMRALVQVHPDSASANYALAIVALTDKALSQAEEALKEALRLKPDWAQPKVLLARVYIGKGDKLAAQALLDQAVQADPDSVLLRTARARLRVDMGDLDGALADFRHLHEQEPDNPEFLYGVGTLAMREEHWEEARSAWQALRNLGGDHRSEATYFLARVEEQLGRPEVAQGLYRSVQDGPLLVDAGLRLAALEAEGGELAQARERLQRLREIDPARAADTYMAEARLLREAGDEAGAGAVLDQAVAQHPDDLELRYGRAMHAARVDDLATLEKDLRYILARDPRHVDALNALGYTLADRTHRLDEAERYIREALSLQPDNAAILDSMGWLLYRRGDYAGALDYLRRALDRMQDPEIAAHLGEVLWVTGDRKAAREVWRKALQAAPGSEVIREVMERLE